MCLGTVLLKDEELATYLEYGCCHHHHHFICSEPNNTAYDSDANEQDQQGSTSANSGPNCFNVDFDLAIDNYQTGVNRFLLAN